MSKQDLKDAYEKFNAKTTFAPGDIVEWKPGMKHKRSEGPFVVMEVLDAPILDGTTDAGSPYFREPLDVVLARIDGYGDFIAHHYDSRRFQLAD